nr:MAG TPA: hypothetical protein [Caudoviricetes sp.]
MVDSSAIGTFSILHSPYNRKKHGKIYEKM